MSDQGEDKDPQHEAKNDGQDDQKPESVSDNQKVIEDRTLEKEAGSPEKDSEG